MFHVKHLVTQVNDPRIVVDLSDEDAMEDLAGALLQHVGMGDRCACGEKFELPFMPQPYQYRPVALHMRDVMLEQLKADASDVRYIEADALIDAAEVIKLRIDKKVAPMLAVEAQLGMAGYMANLMRSGSRAVMALTVEGIMYRWLMARSEAVRTRD